MRVGASIALAAWFVLLLTNTYFFASGPDSSGYMNGARLLASGRPHVPIEALRLFNLPDDMTAVFVPYGFAVHRAGVMVPSFPPGLPLHLAALGSVGGWSVAPFVLAPVVAALCLVMCFALGREMGLTRNWALAPPLMLAFFPVFIEHALQPASDNLAMLYALISIYSAYRAHRSAGWAILAGVAFGMGVWVRPTNFLLLVPLAIALRVHLPLLLRAAAGALPVGVAIGSMNLWLYGAWWKSGYGSFGEYIARTPVCGAFHVEWMARILSLVVFPGAFFVLADRKVSWWTRATLAVWFAVLFAFYSFYTFCDQPFAIRFLLPAVPALVIGAALVLQDLIAPRTRVVAILVLIAVPIFHIYRTQTRYDVWHGEEHESIYPETVAWTERQIPSNALVVSGLMTGAYRYYAPQRITMRWDQLNADRSASLQSSAAGTLPWYALLSDVECSAEELERRVPGGWEVVGRNRDVTLYRIAQ